MKVLFIEDDPNKQEKIAGFLKATFPSTALEQVRSYNAGYNALIKERFDLVLLDMSLPMFDITEREDGYAVDPYAGRYLLMEMERKEIFIPVVVITQFDTFGEAEEFKTLAQLDSELRQQFPVNYRDSVFYSPAEENWKSRLESIVRNL